MESSSRKRKLPLFYPEIDPPHLKYTEADRIRAFRSQPLDFIKRYLIPKGPDEAVLLPPIMHLAWLVDQDRMYEYALAHGVNAMVYDHDGDHRNYFDACNEAVNFMLEDFGIPYDPRIEIVYVCKGDYNPDAIDPEYDNFHPALSIGTNYQGLIPEEQADKLKAFLAPGVQPRWYLDQDEWNWSKAPKRAKSNGKSKPKKKTPTPSNDLGASS
ncbi:uncharacterized protein STEHIDRAFT_115550 [Stereum hirsutum FP-91666 SS1]|uniref:uncharacterized protein n=1 Tax=Stereum hirsutum (strain FP-91666) TaxID=721885 RepID=UPI000444A3E1|nr:uncharacterized protein STEHIDRAFT_115550 [Stereum hirsutum FP-91666 SS1]EIM80676.1 hypothetical protein STEHIDRAFT_115550 [Stereum hirsutum FP-91666 SS1]